MERPRQNVLGTRRPLTRSMTQNTLLIPDELVCEICLRLPSKAIARCRCVSKLWSSILCSQYFTESFFTKSCARPQIIFTCRDDDKIFFSSVPQLQNLEGKPDVVAANHLAPFACSHGFSGCTNGLFCYSGEWFYKGQEEAVSVAVIFNPTTGQSLTLPKLKSRMIYGVKTYIGYDPIAKEFQVLSMACPFVNNVLISVDHQVLTLGTKRLSWRKVQCLIPHLPSPEDYICFGGVLYYIAGAPSTYRPVVKSMVISFDLRTGKFSSVKLMEKAEPYSPTLVDYNGRLGLLMSEDPGDGDGIWESKSIELWVLQDAAKHEWSKHVYMLPVSWKDILGEGMLIVGMIGTNEIVLSPWYQKGPSYVIYYNVESETITKVGIQGMDAFQGKFPQIYPNFVENVKRLKHFK